MSDDGNEGAFGFSMPLPPEFLEHLRNHDDRAKMRREATAQRFFNFLDGLSVDDLITLRYILNGDERSSWNNFVDGQVITILRLVHRVNADTGKPLFPEVEPS